MNVVQVRITANINTYTTEPIGVSTGNTLHGQFNRNVMIHKRKLFHSQNASWMSHLSLSIDWNDKFHNRNFSFFSINPFSHDFVMNFSSSRSIARVVFLRARAITLLVTRLVQQPSGQGYIFQSNGRTNPVSINRFSQMVIITMVSLAILLFHLPRPGGFSHNLRASNTRMCTTKKFINKCGKCLETRRNDRNCS